MKFQGQPNRWSCSVAAAAMIMDVPIADVIERIGHDGSEIVFPDLPFPGCYAGFDIQEIIDVALHFGWSVTGVESRPHVTNDGKQTRELFSEEKVVARMGKYFDLFSGVVVGKSAGRWWHNVAWDHESQTWYDPAGPILPRENPPIKIAVFHIFQKTERYLAGNFLQQLINRGTDGQAS